MEMGDLERLAESIYERAGYDEEDVATPLEIAQKLFGPTGVRLVAGQVPPGTLGTLNGQRLIGVRKSLPDQARLFAIGHELGHWVLERERCGKDAVTERACDYIGAALMVPRGPFRSAVRVHNDNWTELALDFDTTETMVALRYGEVIGSPVAVIAPATLRVRGAEYAWPDTPEKFRRLAKLPSMRGMKRARLKDDPRRVVLEAGELFDEVG